MCPKILFLYWRRGDVRTLRTVLRRFAENVEVKDLKNPGRVDDQHDDEPHPAPGARRFPECETFPDNRPDKQKSEQDARTRSKLANTKCIAEHVKIG